MKAAIVLCLALCAIGSLASRDLLYESSVSRCVSFTMKFVRRA